MIIFKTVRWKNFLSTGNQFTEIQLDRSPTTLIIGENGAGKSTILDALCFGLFNKPFRNIAKKQLVNSVNNGRINSQARRYIRIQYLLFISLPLSQTIKGDMVN